MKNKLSGTSRLLLLIAAIGLVVVLFTPIWRIELDAPQYPEGLGLQIHANELRGNVDIINGLNHYIGMKTLHNEDFFEFTILPYIIIFFVVAFALVALLGKRIWMNILFFLFVSFGIIAMVDFWRWEYNYGHNLDPNAAIIVPGMAYQPPLIGFKQLLNFGAYSIPDTGGWIFIGVGALILFCFIKEWMVAKKVKKNLSPVSAILPVLLLVFLSSCSTKPEPIKVGTDNCYFCKMTITDARFGAELITQKGKVYKFDDVHCILDFLQAKAVEEKEISGIYLTDYSNGNQLVKATEALLLQSEDLRSPMNGNVAAFSGNDSLKKIMENFKGKQTTWNELVK